MDSDDISFSERIKKQVYFLEKNLDIVVCGSRVKKLNNCHKTEYSKEVTISNEIKVALFFQNTLSHPSVMIRKKVLDKNNYKYNESFKTTQDYELWSRIADRHKLANLSEVLLSYRQHKENISTKNQFEQMNNAFLVRKNLAEKLMDRPLTNKEIALHKVLTDPKISDIVVPMELMLEWIIMLYRRNQQTALYNKYYFRKHLTFAWKTYLKKMSKYNLRLMGPGVSLILKRNFKCSNLFFIIKLISWCVWY